MPPEDRIAIENLLAHDGWVRSLAVRLVRDEGDADDLMQDAWLAAMRRPPGRTGSIRGWLGTVLRNRARERHRGETRRTTRESARARPDHAPATDEVVSRADAHRHLVSGLLKLQLLLAAPDNLNLRKPPYHRCSNTIANAMLQVVRRHQSP